MNSHNVLHRLTEQTERICIAEVGFCGVRDILDVIESLDFVCGNAGFRKALIVERNIVHTILNQVL